MNGAELTDKSMALIIEAGGKAINLIAASKSGNADIVACLNGRYIELEVKGEGDTKKSMQELKLRHTVDAGGIGMFVHSLDDTMMAIRLAMTGQPCPYPQSTVKQRTL